MQRVFILFIIILVTGFKFAHARVYIAPKIRSELEHVCQEKVSVSRIKQYLKLRPAQCIALLKNNRKPIQYPPLHKNVSYNLNVHLPRLKVIEEEDDFFNDDLYMWFVITHDGISYSKVTRIYRHLDEGDILEFDDVDRVISDLPFTQKLIIDWGIVESDGDDITQMQHLSDNAFQLIQIALEELDANQRAVALQQLREETTQTMRLLSSLDSDDRLISGTLILDSNFTRNVWEHDHFWEQKQRYSGRHLNSDWSYELTWRFLFTQNDEGHRFRL